MALTNRNSAELQESTVSLRQPICTLCIMCRTFVVWIGQGLGLLNVKVCD